MAKEEAKPAAAPAPAPAAAPAEKAEKKGAPAAGGAPVEKKKDKSKKRTVQVEAVGQAHIKATFNNIVISMTNSTGQVVAWASAGKMGFKGSKKNTPYAAQTAAQECSSKAFELGLRKVEVFVKGPGAGRESAIRTIQNSGIEILGIRDMTPLPHNGCRPPKKRRV